MSEYVLPLNGGPDGQAQGGEDDGKRDPVHAGGPGMPPEKDLAPDHERSGPDADGRRRADRHRDPGRSRIRSWAGSSDSFLLERGIQDEGRMPGGKN